MANEIYNSTWWGDASFTARTLLDGYEEGIVLGGQLEMQERVENESGVLESTICASNELHKIANI